QDAVSARAPARPSPPSRSRRQRWWCSTAGASDGLGPGPAGHAGQDAARARPPARPPPPPLRRNALFGAPDRVGQGPRGDAGRDAAPAGPPARPSAQPPACDAGGRPRE
ncbi:unnamed protein product, partial [Prorocentrum cordatum]